MEQIQIAYLADHPPIIPVCASWAYSQWGCQSDGSLDRSLTKFTAGANKQELPITLVALVGQKPAGMVSLWLSDFDKRPDLSPWLASLFVHPFYRQTHIASSLIMRLELEARRLGYSSLFLITEDAKNLYSKYGWTELEQVKTCFGDASLMKKDLPC